MMEMFAKLYAVLPDRQRRQAMFLAGMMTAMALAETLSIVSIVPFVAVAANPEQLREGGWLGDLYRASGAPGEQQFLIFAGLAALAALILGNAIKAATAWTTHRFLEFTGHSLSLRLLEVYLARPYPFFLARHSAELSKGVLAEAQQVVNGIMQPILTLLSRGVLLAFIATTLLLADPFVAIGVVLLLGGAYAAIFASTRHFVGRIGQQRFIANEERFRIASEVFGGVKEIKLRRLESVYAERYAEPSIAFARTQSANQAVLQLPRYGLEVAAFGAILLIVIYLIATRDGFANAMPLIALYAFAGYRMMPTLQELFAAATQLRFNRPALDRLFADISQDSSALPLPAAPIPFDHEIRLEQVAYTYPTGGDKPVLHGIDLAIPRGARVGFIGPTGAGKSTVIDLILGLLTPTEGRVLIDGRALEDAASLRGWQTRIGYVPQHIFLADDTIAANIAFGETPGREVDQSLVEKAARMAQLHDFIEDELPDGYATPVGERGVRLSGGQRQRLGLARALYRDPTVLVLDEATSALDVETEDAVMAAVEAIGPDYTIIMIAHRLSTVRNCDTLFRLEKGRLVAAGAFADVIGDAA